MKFSIFSVLDHHPNHPRTITQLYNQVLDEIVYAEELGYDAYWVAEHHFHQYGACPNPAVLLAAASRLTSKIGLNIAISTLPFHQPIQIVEDYAMLDVLSNGRLGLGMGRGYLAHEYAGFGQNRDESKGRFDESLAIIEKAWRGERVTFEGKYFKVNDVAVNVLAPQQPMPQHWIAVLSRESFAAWGREGRPIMNIPYATADSFETMCSLADEYWTNLKASGHNPDEFDLPLAFHTHIAPTRAQADAEAREALQLYLDTRLYAKGGSYETTRQRKQLLWGSPDEAIEFIEEYRQGTGTKHIMFLLNFGALEPEKVRSSMEIIAREVIPNFKKQENAANREKITASSI